MTELEQLIYQQLLELYIYDLEVELLAEKLNNARPMTPYPAPVYQPTYPSPAAPWPTHPSWIVTCNATTTAVK